MTVYMTNTELQSMVMEKLSNRRRESVMRSPRRHDGLRKMARALMALIF